VTPKNVTLDNPITLTVARTFYLYLFYLNFYLKLPLHPHRLLEARDVLHILKKVLVNVLRRSVTIRTLAIVKLIHAVTITGTMCAASVMDLTKLKIKENALSPSTVIDSKSQISQHEAATCKACEAIVSGPRQLKRKATNSISEIPCFK
jgi:hypothetical protein